MYSKQHAWLSFVTRTYICPVSGSGVVRAYIIHFIILTVEKWN